MRIADLRATPVAIGDPPLRSAFGLHAPFALRTIVEVELDDGNVGIGETYGGEAPLRALERARPAVVGRDPWQLTPLRIELERLDGNRPAGFAWESRALAGPALFSAIEVACLDAIGRASGRPVADLLGGRVRDRVPFAAYLFFKHAGDDAWGEVMTPEAVVGEARTMRDRYGFHSVKLKGGVLEPDREAEAILMLREALGPDVPLRLDPNAAWSVPTSLRIADHLRGALEYLEDPTPGIDGMSEVAKRAPMPVATNMCVTQFDHIAPAVAKRAVGVILTDHHMWGGMRAGGALPGFWPRRLDALELACGDLARRHGPRRGRDSGAYVRLRHALPLADRRGHQGRKATHPGRLGGRPEWPRPGCGD